MQKKKNYSLPFGREKMTEEIAKAIRIAFAMGNAGVLIHPKKGHDWSTDLQ